MQPSSIIRKRKVCSFCDENMNYIDYKDVKNLRRHISPYSRIMPKERTGTCSKHQRKLSNAIKRARFLGLLPYESK